MSTNCIVQDLPRLLLGLLHLLLPGRPEPQIPGGLDDGVSGRGNRSHYGVTLDWGAMEM